MRKYMQNCLALKINMFCPIGFIDFNNGTGNVNFVCQMVLQVFSYKKQTLTKDFPIIHGRMNSHPPPPKNHEHVYAHFAFVMLHVYKGDSRAAIRGGKGGS